MTMVPLWYKFVSFNRLKYTKNNGSILGHVNDIQISTSLTLLRKIAFLLEISRDAGVALIILVTCCLWLSNQCHLLFRFGETPFSWAASKSWVTWTKFCHFLSKLAFDIIQPFAQCEWHQGLLRPLLSKDGSKQEEGDEEVAFAFPPKESSMRRRWLSLEYFPERNPGWGGGCEPRRKECLLARF